MGVTAAIFLASILLKEMGYDVVLGWLLLSDREIGCPIDLALKY
jgi:hypothetical protein